MGQMVVRFEVEGKLAWKVGQTPNGNWVGICPALNLTLEGETFQELQEIIGEGIQLFLSVAELGADMNERAVEVVQDKLAHKGWAIPYPQEDAARDIVAALEQSGLLATPGMREALTEY